MSANGATSSTSNADESQRGRFFHHRLRRASFISPITGERSKRNFTLLEASNRANSGGSGSINGEVSESTPLIHGDGHEPNDSWLQSNWRRFRQICKPYYDFANSKTGRGIFKCSLAYFLGSLVTFIPALAALIGDRRDSKHMVATVTVWFHPARTLGSMHLATLLGLLGFLYSGVIGLPSMAVSLAAREADVLLAGHVIVLLVFLGGGMGAIAWVKQRFGDPLVNVATALASLGCITVLVREGSVQEGEFSLSSVVQVLLMLLAGIMVATAVNILVAPSSARQALRKDLEENTDLLGELLVTITRAFLRGVESDLQDDYFGQLQKAQQAALQKMNKDLGEAKNEYLVTGHETLYQVSSRLVDCLDELFQDLGGLRSAALAQFALVNSSSHHSSGNGSLAQTTDNRRPSWFNSSKDQAPQILDAITEDPDERNTTALDNETAIDDEGDIGKPSFTPLDRVTSIASVASLKDLTSPEDMFFTFIRQLGPPTKSLVYTLKQILDELPFKEVEDRNQSSIFHWSDSHVEVAITDNFHSSLKDALELYRSSRKDALNTLYASRALSAAFMPAERKGGGAFSSQRTKSGFNTPIDNRQQGTQADRPPEEVLADIEEVSACCGHFSFSLLDFAEDIMTYLDILEDLKSALEHPTYSWRWLMFWRLPWASNRSKFKSAPLHDHEEHGVHHDIPEVIRKADRFADPEKAPIEQPWTWRLYRKLRVFRRDDVRYAIKVAVGAILFALPAFLYSTRPFFTHWRGEWGLVSYMAVCTMTIGAVNTTSINRFIGTFMGACLAIIGWVISADDGEANPYILAIFGWLVSVGCFYLILERNQGPMGRFILLTYNLGALYAYSLSVHDDTPDDDEVAGIDSAIWDIVLHRLVAVCVGTLWAMIIIRLVWPMSARRKVKDGLCILWLRMSLIWKRDPLAMFLLGEPRSNYMDIREEAELHSFLAYLDSLRAAAKAEFQLRGPFPDKIVGRIIERTRRMLDAFHAMNVVITKELQCTPGEAAVLRYTREQRFALSARISHLFSVLASSYKLEYPLNDALPSIENSRDQLLARTSEFRRTEEGRDITTEGDYELLYAYVLVTGQLAQDIEAVCLEIETLFGTLNEENLKLQ